MYYIYLFNPLNLRA